MMTSYQKFCKFSTFRVETISVCKNLASKLISVMSYEGVQIASPKIVYQNIMPKTELKNIFGYSELKCIANKCFLKKLKASVELII